MLFHSLLALALLLSTCLGTKFTGTVVNMKAKTWNRDIIYITNAMFSEKLPKTYPDIKASLNYLTILYIKKIYFNYTALQEKDFLIGSTSMEGQDQLINVLKGNPKAIHFDFNFSFEITERGVLRYSGNGKGVMFNQKSNIYVNFSKQEMMTYPKIFLEAPWGITNLSYSSYCPYSMQIYQLLVAQLSPKVHSECLQCLSFGSKKLFQNYFQINRTADNVKLIINNTLIDMSVAQDGKTIELGFGSLIVTNGYIRQRIYRKMDTESLEIEDGDFQYCFPAQLIPASIDSLGKGGYFDADIDAKEFGFKSNQVGEMFDIMPELKSRYAGQEPFTIHFQVSRFETVNDITQNRSDTGFLQLLYPGYCLFSIDHTGEYFLLVDIFMKQRYEMKIIGKAYDFCGHCIEANLADFRAIPNLGGQGRALLEQHILTFVLTLHERELPGPMVHISPLRNDSMSVKRAYIYDRRIACVLYEEKND